MQNTSEKQGSQGERILSKEIKVDKKLKLSVKSFYAKLGIKLSEAELEDDDGTIGIEYIINKSMELISPVEEKEQKLKELKKSLPYPNNYILASLAERSYEEKNRVLNKNENFHGKEILDGWILLTGAYHNKIKSSVTLDNTKSIRDNFAHNELGGSVGDSNGYFGVAYWNPKMQQVIIVHRGTENVAALGTDSIDSISNADLHGVILNQHVGQIDSAVTFTDEIITVLKKINREKGLKIQLFFTGHSLGAWFAPITAFSAKFLERMGDCFVKNPDFEETGYHTSTVIFDGPGSKSILEHIEEKVMNCSGTHFTNSLDVINYLSAPNMINTCHPQIGDKYLLFIHKSDEEKENFWNMEFNYDVFVQNISRIKGVFDSKTGDVLEDEHGVLRILKVENWPTLLIEKPTTKFLEILETLVNSCSVLQLLFESKPVHISSNIKHAIVTFVLHSLISQSIECHLKMEPELKTSFDLANKFNDFHFDYNNIRDACITLVDNYFQIRDKTLSGEKDYKNIRSLNVFTRSERQFLERYKLLQEYQNVPNSSELAKLFDVFGDEVLKAKFIKLLDEFEIRKDGTVYSSNLSEFIPDIKRMLHFFSEIKSDLDKVYQNSPQDILHNIYDSVSTSYLGPIKDFLGFLNDTFGLKAFLEGNNINFLHGIVHSSTSLGVVKVYKTLNTLKTDYCSFFLNFDKIFYLGESLLIRFLKNVERKYLLVIECDEVLNTKIEEFLKQLFEVMENQNVKVILVTKGESKLNTGFVCEFIKISYQIKSLAVQFKDLTFKSQIKLLEEKKVIFQGKEVPLKTILSKLSYDDLNKIIDPETITDLFVFNNTKIEIGKPLPSLGEVQDYYIDRKLIKKVKVMEGILRDETLTDLFAVSNIDKRELSMLVNGAKVRSFNEDDDRSNPIRFIKLNGNAEESFKILCDSYSDYTIHWLKVDNGSLIWQKSHGKTLSVLRNYIENYENDLSKDKYSQSNTSLKIVDVCNVDEFNEKFIIVAAEIGMGKTIALTRLVTETVDDSKWFIWINLSEYKDRLEQRNFSDLECVVDFLHENGIVSNVLAQNILKNRLQKSGNIVFLLDGFDEITSGGQKNIIDFLKILKRTEVEKVLISTRLHLRNELENNLSTIAYNLKPFFPEDQENFLKKKWQKDIEHELDPEYLDNYITELMEFISSSIDDKERKFMGIPMQMRIVAEAFGEELENLLYSDEFIFPEKFDMLKLYDKFIEDRYTTYFKKKGAMGNCFDEHEMALVAKGFNEVLMHLAIEELYPNLKKNLLDKKLPSERYKEVMNLVGITQCINNRTLFTHPFFAEYFAAHFLVNMLHESELKYRATINFLSIEIFEDKSEVTKTFLDYCLAEDDLLAAVLKGKLDDAKRMLSEVGTNINVTDLLGRSVLHYAAQEGYHEIVDDLLNQGANATADKLGKTALHYAARYNHGTQVVSCILERAEHCINNKDNNGHTALYYADQQGNWDIVDYISTIRGASAEGLDKRKIIDNFKNAIDKETFIEKINELTCSSTEIFKDDLSITEINERNLSIAHCIGSRMQVLADMFE